MNGTQARMIAKQIVANYISDASFLEERLEGRGQTFNEAESIMIATAVRRQMRIALRAIGYEYD